MEDKILEAYENMIKDNYKKKEEEIKEINEGKIKDFLNNLKEEFLVNLWVTGIFKGADLMDKNWKKWEGRDDVISKMKKAMEKAGVKDPFLGKVMKRVELKWKV